MKQGREGRAERGGEKMKRDAPVPTIVIPL